MNCGDCKYSHDTGTALLCWGQRFAPPVDVDHWCEGWKPKSVQPQTNADRIRQMSDEELADFLGGIFTIETDLWGDYDPRLVVTQEPRVEIRDKEGMMDWLKSTEVDNGL